MSEEVSLHGSIHSHKMEMDSNMQKGNQDFGLPLRNIHFELTGRCNLRCKHCYIFEDDRRWAGVSLLAPPNIEKVVVDAVELGLEETTFTGGEILLRKDLVEILQRTSDHVQSIYLLTNLTLLSDEHIKALKRLPISMVSTSIDGFEITHDAFRGQAGAYAMTMASVKRLMDAGIPTKISVTISSANTAEAGRLFAMLDSLGIPTSIASITPVGRGKRLQNEDTRLDSEYILLLAKRLARAVSPKQLFGAQSPGMDLPTHCGVGREILYVMSDGDVGLCPILNSSQEKNWHLGSIHKTSISEIWSKAQELFSRLQCSQIQTCKFGSICRGGCRANAYVASGDVAACDKEMWKGFDQLLTIYKMDEGKPRYRVI